MKRSDKKSAPRSGMTWSAKHRRWIDSDTRSPERRARDEAILAETNSDRERIDELLRRVQNGDSTDVQEAAIELATQLLKSLIAARTEAGLSQAAVARRMGVLQPAVVRLEAGTHSPTPTTHTRYASAIGVDLRVRRPA